MNYIPSGPFNLAWSLYVCAIFFRIWLSGISTFLVFTSQTSTSVFKTRRHWHSTTSACQRWCTWFLFRNIHDQVCVINRNAIKASEKLNGAPGRYLFIQLYNKCAVICWIFHFENVLKPVFWSCSVLLKLEILKTLNI